MADSDGGQVAHGRLNGPPLIMRFAQPTPWLAQPMPWLAATLLAVALARVLIHQVGIQCQSY